MTTIRPATLAASITFSAARIALGGLWLHEGVFKYNAHFGSADILLVADGAKSNTRVPHYFTVFADNVLHRWPEVFGFLIPLIEVSLGVALIVGILTLPAALASSLTLIMYWSSDQLIAQYPIMAALSTAVLLCPALAAHISATSIMARRQWSNTQVQTVIAGPMRRWL